MLNSNYPLTPQGMVRVAQIVVIGLVVGVLSAATVMAIVAKPQFPDHQLFGIFGAVLATAVIIAPLVVPPMLQPSEQAFAGAPPYPALMQFVLMKVIVRGALLEGIGMVNAVIYFLTGSYLAFGAAIAVVIALAVHVPTQSRFDAEIERLLQQRRDESQFR